MNRLTVAGAWLWCVVSALVYYIVLLPLTLAGFFLVPIAFIFAEWRESRIYPGRHILAAPDWLFIYGNEQDGFIPEPSHIPAYYAEWRFRFARWLPDGVRTFILAYLWAAWRNKVSNIRFLGWPKIRSGDELEVVAGGSNWYIIRSGWLMLWLWARPESRTFTQAGARIDKAWSKFGVNFTIRLNGRY